MPDDFPVRIKIKELKRFLTILLCIAFLAACQQEEMGPVQSAKGHICLRLSADDAVQTRALQDVDDPSTWFAVVTDGTSTLYDQQIGTQLGARDFDAGTYDIAVRSHDDLAAAVAADNGWGAAYFEGAANAVEVSAGGTAYVHIACGRALNAKFRLSYSEFSGVINALSVTAPKTITFAYADGTLARDAFFMPNAVLTYTITYTLGGTTKTTEPQTLTLGGAATVSTLVIKSDINGELNVSLTCDDAFEDDAESEIIINGATGKA